MRSYEYGEVGSIYTYHLVVLIYSDWYECERRVSYGKVSQVRYVREVQRATLESTNFERSRHAKSPWSLAYGLRDVLTPKYGYADFPR